MYYSKTRNTFSKYERVTLNMEVSGIPIVNEYKWLGILLDKRLSGQLHLKELEKKIEKYLKLIRILNYKNFPVHVRMELFKSLCLSSMYYGSFLFNE